MLRSRRGSERTGRCTFRRIRLLARVLRELDFAKGFSLTRLTVDLLLPGEAARDNFPPPRVSINAEFMLFASDTGLILDHWTLVSRRIKVHLYHFRLSFKVFAIKREYLKIFGSIETVRDLSFNEMQCKWIILFSRVFQRSGNILCTLTFQCFRIFSNACA